MVEMDFTVLLVSYTGCEPEGDWISSAAVDRWQCRPLHTRHSKAKSQEEVRKVCNQFIGP